MNPRDSQSIPLSAWIIPGSKKTIAKGKLGARRFLTGNVRAAHEVEGAK